MVEATKWKRPPERTCTNAGSDPLTERSTGLKGHVWGSDDISAAWGVIHCQFNVLLELRASAVTPVWDELHWTRSRRHCGDQDTWTGDVGTNDAKLTKLMITQFLCQHETGKCFDTDGEKKGVPLIYLCRFLQWSHSHSAVHWNNPVHVITLHLNEEKLLQELRKVTNFRLK